MVPIDTVVAEALDGLNLEHIQITWQRALARIHEEPDAAITSARTLLESTCKSILEHYGASEADYKKLNLQNLFLKTWESLGTSQQQKSLEQIQTKLGELIAAFGTLRNEYGDAHGRGLSSLSPTQLEAEFAVNLAGTMTLVLIRRFEEAR